MYEPIQSESKLPNVFDVPCGECSAGVRQTCVTGATNRSWVLHRERYEDARDYLENVFAPVFVGRRGHRRRRYQLALLEYQYTLQNSIDDLREDRDGDDMPWVSLA